MGFHAKLVTLGLCAAVVAGCGAKAGGDGAAPVNTAPAAAPSSQTGALRAGDEAPPAEQTGGFEVETDSFSADTPAERLAMKNIVAKIPGDKPGIIMLATHYDTKRLEHFVGADDGASSTAVMLELAVQARG